MKKKVKKGSKSKVFSKPKSFFTKKENSHICDPISCHNVDLANYCFYQTAQTVKIYITIPRVETLSKSKIKIKFQKKSFELSVYDLLSSNYHLTIENLAFCIIPNKCKYFIRKDKIILELAKEAQRIWKSLEEIVSKEEWIQLYCELLEDIPDFGDDQALFEFAEGMWDQLNKLHDKDFNYLKPPPRMHELIPSLRKTPCFKSLDEATDFYKTQLKKDRFNESLYIILGGCLLEKQRMQKVQLMEVRSFEKIEESTLGLRRKKKVMEEEAAEEEEEEEDGARRLAEEKKVEGNALYKTGKFYAALQLYLEAIELCPEGALFYSNASASYMMLGMFPEALGMAQKAVKADETLGKAHLRVGRCNLALGNTKAALKALKRARETGESEEDVEAEEGRTQELLRHLREGKAAAGTQDYAGAADWYGKACGIASGSPSLLFLWAECLTLCGRPRKARSLATRLLEERVEDADAHCILGMVAYYQDDQEEALRQWELACGIARGHTKARALRDLAQRLYDLKERGNEAFRSRKLDEAARHYEAGLRLDPKNRVVAAKLHYNLAAVHAAKGAAPLAIRSLSAALEAKPDYVKAYLKRAAHYQEVCDHTRALRDLKKALQLEPTEANERLLREGQALQRKHSSKDHYATLRVSRKATPDQIKAAYHRLALLHHPDKHEAPGDKRAHEALFKEVTEAYGVLKDERRRAQYDLGEDLKEEDLGGEEEDLLDLFHLYMFSQFLGQRDLSAFFGDAEEGADDYNTGSDYDSEDYDYYDDDDDYYFSGSEDADDY